MAARARESHKREATLQLCVYCQQRPATTREHVFARCLFDKFPEQMMTVPTCAPCNSGTGDGINRPLSMDEEYVRTVLSVLIAGYGSPAAEAVANGPVARQLKRRPQLGRKLAETVERVTLREKSGILVPGQMVMKIDVTRIDRVLRKITKGLFAHFTGRPLPTDYDVRVVSGVKHDDFYQLLALMRQTNHVGPCNYGEGIVTFIGTIGGRNPDETVWLMTLYNRFIALTYTRKQGKSGIVFADIETKRRIAVIDPPEP